MLNCLGSDFVLGEDCIEERSVRGHCGEESDALLEKASHLIDCGACRRGQDGNVVAQNDDSRAVLRNSDIAANDSEIGASLFKGFGALLQIIDGKNNKSNGAASTLQMMRNRPDEFCVVAIGWSDGDFKHLRPRQSAALARRGRSKQMLPSEKTTPRYRSHARKLSDDVTTWFQCLRQAGARNGLAGRWIFAVMSASWSARGLQAQPIGVLAA